MTKTELIDMLDEYKMGLLSKATDGTIDDKYYIQTRNALLENVSIKEQIPQFIRSCRTADEFIMKEGVGNIVFDFEDTRFMDSSGIGIIIGRYKKISYFGGKVFAINADTRVKRTLMICGLHKVIEIME